MNNNLDKIWSEIEQHSTKKRHIYQRMIYVDLIYRAYIGSSGTPAKRYIALEIPESDKSELDAINVTQGFTLLIDEPVIKHFGFVTCIIQATSADQNDVFTIVAKDILNELRIQKSSEEYIKVLKNRIEKWRLFFKGKKNDKLTDETVIGLIGELMLIQELVDMGYDTIVDMWNGPLRSAQDFQDDEIAIEVKSVVKNVLDYVDISNENQLDDIGREALFLVVLRLERNDVTGIKLPELILSILSKLKEHQRRRLQANLTCLGYNELDAWYYIKGYSIKDSFFYQVNNEFPRLIPIDIPSSVTNVSYRLSLKKCDLFKTSRDHMCDFIKELHYGKDRRTK